MKDASKIVRDPIKNLVFSIVLSVMGCVLSVHGVWAGQVQISGSGPIGTQDPANQFSTDGGVTWQDAWIVTPNPAYSVIPGTNYISSDSGGSGMGDNTTVRYRTVIWPCACPKGRVPVLTVKVHADNVADLVLNGSYMGGAQDHAEIYDNFQNPPGPQTFPSGVFAVGAPPFTPIGFPPVTYGPVVRQAVLVPGPNVLTFDLTNYSGPSALDYEATVECRRPKK